MDEYGTYRATTEDWDELAALFKEKENILFPYSADAQSAMIISINREFFKKGNMPFGGNPAGRAWISVLGRGADHIDIDNEQHATYLQEHIGLPSDNAAQVAQLLNELRKRRT
jgi:hypothetical protein